MQARVALVRCETYAASRRAIEEALDLLGPGADVFAGKRVALKVNMMKGAAPDRALCTHPEFVRALARVVKHAGGTPLVCDSSGILAFTAEAFEAAGYTAMCADEGIDLIDLDRDPPVRREIAGRVLDHAWFGRAAVEADLLVTVPKLKTHTIAKLTCALKNHMGLVAGATKCRVHETAPRPSRFAEAVVDLNVGLPADLAIVDGVVGLDGGGTIKGRTPRETHVVLAGSDPVAVDAVAGALIGLAPDGVATTTAAAARGLGAADLDDIEIVGASLDACRTPYEPSGFELKRFAPAARAIYGVRGHSVRPIVVAEACTACGTCAEVCPTDAVSVNGVARIDPRACIRCYACRARCPEGAIKIKCKAYLKRTFRKKAEGLPLRDLV